RYAHALAPGHKADGAVFNRFGMLDQMGSGGSMEVYVGDLTLDGRRIDLSRDPGWEARGNHVSFPDRGKRPDHDSGYSPTTFAGGKKGEVGGVIWRDEAPAYYADRVGPLTLDDELEASGRLAFTGGLSDSGACFGWFDAASKRGQKANTLDPPKN